MRAGLKDTLFPDDPFGGLGGMPHAQRAWRVASYFVPALDWGAGYSAASFWYDLLADVHRFVLPAAVGVRGDGELEEPRGGAGGHVVAAGGVHHRRQGEGFRRPTAVHVARLHVGLLHRCPAGHSWIPQAGDPDGFHVTAGDHRVHGRHGGRDHAAAAQGHPRHDALTTKKVSAFVVGAITLIVAPFAVPSASFTRDIGRAVAECAEHDGGHGRGEAEAAREVGDRRGRSGTRGGSEDAEVEEEEEREHREGGAARRGGERGENCAREREEGKDRVMTWQR
uniref:Uncharacterized protein n=1 Tax=Oryza nivara TaxID=4536 RepID=A0A0E0HMU6_ORYNI